MINLLKNSYQLPSKRNKKKNKTKQQPPTTNHQPPTTNHQQNNKTTRWKPTVPQRHNATKPGYRTAGKLPWPMEKRRCQRWLEFRALHVRAKPPCSLGPKPPKRGNRKTRWFLGVFSGLNSHYFHIIGDGHQPNNRVLYTSRWCFLGLNSTPMTFPYRG